TGVLPGRGPRVGERVPLPGDGSGGAVPGPPRRGRPGVGQRVGGRGRPGERVVRGPRLGARLHPLPAAPVAAAAVAVVLGVVVHRPTSTTSPGGRPDERSASSAAWSSTVAAAWSITERRALPPLAPRRP